MKFHGILTIQDPDHVGETMEVTGIDFGPLRQRGLVSLMFDSEAANVVGTVTAVQAVLNPEQEPDAELRQLAGGKPFVKVEVDVPGLGGTKGAVLLRAMAPRPEGQGDSGAYYFGVGGTVLEREGKTIKAAVVNQVAIVLHGIHRAQRVLPGPLKTG